MKKAVLFWVSLVLFAGFVYSVPTDEQIRQAAGTLGVPFADLKSFVQYYQAQNAQVDVITITAADLDSAYKANALRADSMYKNKTVKITGKVKKLGQYSSGGAYIQLEGQGGKYVEVRINPSETARASGLNPGQTVTLIGTCDEFYGSTLVIIKDATFSR
jgi:hypothetical protein